MAGQRKKMTHTVQAVRAARIFCLDGKPPLDDGVIVYDTESRHILQVGLWDELHPACEVTDLKKAWIVPGLFNCHIHFELCGGQSLKPTPVSPVPRGPVRSGSGLPRGRRRRRPEPRTNTMVTLLSKILSANLDPIVLS